MGDFSIDVSKNEDIIQHKLDVFLNIFNRTHLVIFETCYKNNCKLTIELILTNKPLCFQFNSDKEVLVIVTG